MKPNRYKSLMIGVFLVVMLLVGIGSTSADAQNRRGIHRPSRIIVYRPYNPFWFRHYDPFWDSFYYPRTVTVDPIAYQRERGYKEGRDEGKDDAKKSRPANARGHKDYLKSNSITFREAFVQGYNEGYREKIAEIREKMRDKHGD